MDRVSVFIVGLCLAGMVSGEYKTVSAVIGDDVTLPCEAKEHLPFEVVEWSRPTGGNPEYILFFKDNKIDPSKTSKRYQGRVKLQDPQNGDASLDLKNVMAEDKGTYECYVLKASKRRKRSIDQPISTVYLDVRPPSHGKIGLIVGLLVAVALIAAVAAFVLKKKQKSPFSW